MLNVQNNYNVPRSNIYFKSNFGMRLVRNLCFSNMEKSSIDALTRGMYLSERNLIIKQQAYVAGFKPLNMLKNLYSNFRAKLV